MLKVGHVTKSRDPALVVVRIIMYQVRKVYRGLVLLYILRYSYIDNKLTKYSTYFE